MKQDTDVMSNDELRAGGTRPGLNWALAALTIPGAALVMLFAVGQVMGTTGCTDELCRRTGPGEFWFGVLCYGAPIVALATLGLSFFTAKKRWGIAVPLIGLALLVGAGVVLSMTFSR
ncbi:hypothetical protein [Mycolicibacterium sp.]|uniref:hypothetical protein n=1 Tax=Mycolicibacterium sp. TaxID=2320850 RepID=UPI001A1F3D1F|nr:hypothetical protein [Mycolicibacterium sp.]MBJ7338131.1 hypothetical protein [Mycolicibacterium sp.]